MMTARMPVAVVLIFSAFVSTADAAPPKTVKPTKPPPPSERFALVVGVGHYDDPQLVELYADNDALKFAKVLETYAGFPKDNITVLTTSDQRADHRPTHQAILDALRQLANSASREKGLLLFYYSGHGQNIDDETVLFPSDLKYYGKPIYLKETGGKASV